MRISDLIMALGEAAQILTEARGQIRHEAMERRRILAHARGHIWDESARLAGMYADHCILEIDYSTPAAPEYVAPLIPESEILRVGMSGGRALIETTKAKPRKDTQTLDLFDTELTLF